VVKIHLADDRYVGGDSFRPCSWSNPISGEAASGLEALELNMADFHTANTGHCCAKYRDSPYGRFPSFSLPSIKSNSI
jgi:hypothetical protein